MARRSKGSYAPPMAMISIRVTLEVLVRARQLSVNVSDAARRGIVAAVNRASEQATERKGAKGR